MKILLAFEILIGILDSMSTKDKTTIYYDESDPTNVGWAYRTATESGEIDHAPGMGADTDAALIDELLALGLAPSSAWLDLGDGCPTQLFPGY